jgi:methionine salvage enolase-phosphatase E1
MLGKKIREECELREILKIVKEDGLYKTTREIAEIIINYYKKNKKVMDIAKMQQLIWTVKAHQGYEEGFIDKLVTEFCDI